MNALVDKLVEKFPPEDIYPPDVVDPIKPKIRGRSFFPGGCGLYDGAGSSLAGNPVMLVGQDFGTREYWNEVGLSGEAAQGTWSGLIRMLAEGNIDPRNCFFTNILLGVRARGPIDGPSPGLACHRYVASCTEYLIEQIRLVRPSVVVTLGKVPSILLACQLGLTSQIEPPCENDARNPTWPQIDADIEPFQASVPVTPQFHIAFATSVHPDRHWLNYGHRAWPVRGVQGKQAHDLIWKCIADAQRIPAHKES